MRGVKTAGGLLLCVLLVSLAARPVSAVTITVTTTADLVAADGQVSLREAVTAASTNLPSVDAPAGSPGYDVIRFAPSLTAGGPVTITLVGPEFILSDEVEIIGPGRDRLSISGNNTSRPFRVTSFTSATLAGLTIRDGVSPVTFSGGGVNGDTTSILTLRDCRLTSNTARRRGGGASMQGGGTMTLTDCLVDGNLGEEAAGGVEFSSGATGSLTRCVIQGNRTGSPTFALGGGIGWIGGSGSITDCVIADNVVPNASGGGLFARNSSVVITRSTFSGNRAEQSAGGGGDGGGLFADNSTNLTLTNCTISGNEADDSGGGIAWQASSGAVIALENCTIANNTADADASGAGTGGGIHRSGGTVRIANTIVAGNTDRTTLRPDISGTITSFGYNLIGSLGTQAFSSNATGDRYGDPGNTTTPSAGAIESATTVSAVLGALAYNGGYGFTHLPGGGSPALNNANPSTTVTVDQRGLPRPSGANYDIGSVEVGGCATGGRVVTTTADNAGGSLRDAVLLACPNSIITFAPSVTANGPTTITLTGGQLVLDKNLTIIGPGRDLLAITANGASRVASQSSGTSVTISGLTMTGGFAVGNGGVIDSAGTLHVADCRLRNSTATTDGGAISTTKPLRVTNTEILDNLAGDDGGGIAVQTLGATAQIEDCLLARNRVNGGAPSLGGGLYLSNNVQGSMSNTTIEGSTAAGIGAGFCVEFSSVFTVSNSTISGNESQRTNLGGGGIYVENSTCTLVNSTISGNRSRSGGGGVYVAGASITNATLENCTVTGNICDADSDGTGDGGGVFLNVGTLSLANTIVAGNTDNGSQQPDLGGAVTSRGYNLIGTVGTQNFSSNRTGDRYGDPSGTTTANPGAIESATVINALLAGLASNGGPTRTHVPQPGSPAINNGDPNTTVTTDQRGVARPLGGADDIGAVEFRTLNLGAAVDGLDYPNNGTYDFGSVPVGQTVPKVVVLTNTGDELVTPTQFSAAGDAELSPNLFQWVTGPLAPNQTRSQDVTFTPSSASSFGKSMQFFYTGGSLTLNLSGNGCQPTVVVSNTNDSGAGSLRQAVKDVCPEGIITFAPALTAGGPATILLTSGEVVIPVSVTIAGPGRDLLTVSGGYRSRVFFYDAGTSVTIQNLTVSNGAGVGNGGAISAGGPLTLIGSRVSESWSIGDGAGVYARDRVQVTDSEFVKCEAGDDGGGLTVAGPADAVVLERVLFDSNRTTASSSSIGAGADFRFVSSVMVSDCVFQSNEAEGVAGGLYLSNITSSTVDGVLFWNNQANVNVGNGGGGLFSAETTVTVSNSTFSANRADESGGGLLVGGSSGVVTAENCTFTGNVCDDDASGTGQGGGVSNPGGALVLANTIVAGNTDKGGERPDISGTVRSYGYNLIGTVGTQAFGNNTTGDRYGDPGATTTPNPGAVESATAIDARLGPLDNYGGPIRTHDLLSGSPAINTGDPATTVSVDQRDVPRPVQSGFDIGAVERAAYVNYQCQFFITNELTAPGSSTGWSSSGFNSALGFVDYSLTETAIRLYVAPSADRFRIAGVLSNFSEWLSYTNVGPGNLVRGKFYMFAGGQPNPADLNQIPNLRMRLSTRFAVNSMLEVFHHDPNEGDAGQRARYAETRPTASATSPSLYRVDFDVIDVPYLLANAAGEGVLRGVEAYAIYPSDQGYLGLAEACIGTYPAAVVSPKSPLGRRYETGAGGAGSLAAFFPAGEVNLFNLIPGATEGEFGTAETVGSLPTYSEGAGGITLASGAVPTNRVGVAAREINIDGSATSNLRTRPRVSAGRQYSIRWHLTSTQQVNQQAQIRLRARTNKFGWSQKYEIGGAWGTGGGLYPLNANNSIAQESLPGVGCQNPDQRTPGEQGGWYHLIMHSPLSSDIRADFPPGTAITTTMPNLSAQPGPGVNSASRRDLFVGLDLVDTISGGGGRFLEAGHVTVDTIEIREQTVVAD